MNQPLNALLLIKGGGFSHDEHRENTSQQGGAPSETTMGKCMSTFKRRKILYKFKYYKDIIIL